MFMSTHAKLIVYLDYEWSKAKRSIQQNCGSSQPFGIAVSFVSLDIANYPIGLILKTQINN